MELPEDQNLPASETTARDPGATPSSAYSVPMDTGDTTQVPPSPIGRQMEVSPSNPVTTEETCSPPQYITTPASPLKETILPDLDLERLKSFLQALIGAGDGTSQYTQRTPLIFQNLVAYQVTENNQELFRINVRGAADEVTQELTEQREGSSGSEVETDVSHVDVDDACSGNAVAEDTEPSKTEDFDDVPGSVDDEHEEMDTEEAENVHQPAEICVESPCEPLNVEGPSPTAEGTNSEEEDPQAKENAVHLSQDMMEEILRNLLENIAARSPSTNEEEMDTEGGENVVHQQREEYARDPLHIEGRSPSPQENHGDQNKMDQEGSENVLHHSEEFSAESPRDPLHIEGRSPSPEINVTDDTCDSQSDPEGHFQTTGSHIPTFDSTPGSAFSAPQPQPATHPAFSGFFNPYYPVMVVSQQMTPTGFSTTMSVAYSSMIVPTSFNIAPTTSVGSGYSGLRPEMTPTGFSTTMSVAYSAMIAPTSVNIAPTTSVRSGYSGLGPGIHPTVEPTVSPEPEYPPPSYTSEYGGNISMTWERRRDPGPSVSSWEPPQNQGPSYSPWAHTGRNVYDSATDEDDDPPPPYSVGSYYSQQTSTTQQIWQTVSRQNFTDPEAAHSGGWNDPPPSYESVVQYYITQYTCQTLYSQNFVNSNIASPQGVLYMPDPENDGERAPAEYSPAKNTYNTPTPSPTPSPWGAPPSGVLYMPETDEEGTPTHQAEPEGVKTPEPEPENDEEGGENSPPDPETDEEGSQNCPPDPETDEEGGQPYQPEPSHVPEPYETAPTIRFYTRSEEPEPVSPEQRVTPSPVAYCPSPAVVSPSQASQTDDDHNDTPTESCMDTEAGQESPTFSHELSGDTPVSAFVVYPRQMHSRSPLPPVDEPQPGPSTIRPIKKPVRIVTCVTEPEVIDLTADTPECETPRSGLLRKLCPRCRELVDPAKHIRGEKEPAHDTPDCTGEE